MGKRLARTGVTSLSLGSYLLVPALITHILSLSVRHLTRSLRSLRSLTVRAARRSRGTKDRGEKRTEMEEIGSDSFGSPLSLVISSVPRVLLPVIHSSLRSARKETPSRPSVTPVLTPSSLGRVVPTANGEWNVRKEPEAERNGKGRGTGVRQTGKTASRAVREVIRVNRQPTQHFPRSCRLSVLFTLRSLCSSHLTYGSVSPHGVNE